ncbi:hypothetical protein, partial [Accumulibacter sp.]|uniref:hypothetical protein n=1 Tax=Accumulibacter sp. TaxID=2053492 RepID=UPI002CA38267
LPALERHDAVGVSRSIVRLKAAGGTLPPSPDASGLPWQFAGTAGDSPPRTIGAWSSSSGIRR